MTTAHADETIEEAWFFSNAAWPEEDGYTCRLWLAATVGNPLWAEKIKMALAAQSD